jgi:CubicO group peptidase (beta-lactamase class C family)
MILRATTPADRAAGTALVLACWRRSYAGLLPQGVLDGLTDEQAAALWARALASGRPGLVAERDGALVGVTVFGRLDDPPGQGHVHSLYVDPAAQGEGVGGALLAAAEAELTAAGAGGVTLWCFAANTPGLAFYRRHGLLPDGATRVEPEFGVLEVRLRREAADPATAAAVGRLLAGPRAPAGAVVATLDGGRRALSWSGAARSDGRPVTRDTAFDLASVTKVVATVTALMSLVSQCQLSLDNHLGDFLPDAGPARGATLRDLLLHRAGLWEWQPLYLAPEPGAALTALPLRHPPGATHYSDLGFMLLGRVIERVTGQSLRDAVATLVTGPLGLTRTCFAPVPVGPPVAASAVGQAEERTMVATGEPYPVLWPDRGFAWRTGELAGEANDGNAHHVFGGAAGHAGLFSTADDLLTWLGHLAAPDLDPARARFFDPGPDPAQALGWRVGPSDPALRHHPGFTGAAVALWPGQARAVVMLSNRLLRPAPSTGELFATVLATIGAT